MTYEQVRAIRNGLLVRRRLYNEALDKERRVGRLTGHEDLVASIKRIDRAVARMSRRLVLDYN